MTRPELQRDEEREEERRGGCGMMKDGKGWKRSKLSGR